MTQQTLEIVTTAVNRDEPAFSLREINESTPDFKERHRYQIIRVVRGDSLATYRRDLGTEGETGPVSRRADAIRRCPGYADRSARSDA